MRLSTVFQVRSYQRKGRTKFRRDLFMESCGNSAMRAHSGCSLYIIVLGASSYSSSKSDTELHIYFKNWSAFTASYDIALKPIVCSFYLDNHRTDEVCLNLLRRPGSLTSSALAAPCVQSCHQQVSRSGQRAPPCQLIHPPLDL